MLDTAFGNQHNATNSAFYMTSPWLWRMSFGETMPPSPKPWEAESAGGRLVAIQKGKARNGLALLRWPGVLWGLLLSWRRLPAWLTHWVLSVLVFCEPLSVARTIRRVNRNVSENNFTVRPRRANWTVLFGEQPTLISKADWCSQNGIVCNMIIF